MPVGLKERHSYLEMTLAAHNLGFSYGSRAVLCQVSLEVNSGEVVGILGPNGAGKSTLARLLLGLQTPSTGRVTIDGAEMATLSVSDRARKIGALLQGELPTFAYTVFELVMFARTARRASFSSPSPDDHDAVRRALAAADVTHLSERPLRELSGGERQRARFARALAQTTPYLVLDEPTAALDLQHQQALATKVHGLSQGVVWILHDPDLALRYCDRVLVLERGCTVVEGSPTEVLSPELLLKTFGVRAERAQSSAGAHLLVTGVMGSESE
jgi:iron complex transport system ATP-binding protein